jgi:O-acetyl-ADP-ribose deacetylase (regulator of RNase III)
MTGRIVVVGGDITKQRVDAIVNAANSALLGGGGVDGAIHRAAGPQLFAECRAIGWCDTGDTVGPVWDGGDQGEDADLARSYRRSLALAEEHGIRSIAFPAISTGVYGFPLERATRIAVREVRDHLQGSTQIEEVRFVCFDRRVHDVYVRVVAEFATD